GFEATCCLGVTVTETQLACHLGGAGSHTNHEDSGRRVLDRSVEGRGTSQRAHLSLEGFAPGTLGRRLVVENQCFAGRCRFAFLSEGSSRHRGECEERENEQTTGERKAPSNCHGKPALAARPPARLSFERAGAPHARVIPSSVAR